jgi:uncharacterized protein YqeY
MAYYNGTLTLTQTGHMNDPGKIDQIDNSKKEERPVPKGTSGELTKPIEEAREVIVNSETYKKIKADIITAMKAKESDKVLILRGLDGAIQLKAKNDLVEIDEGLVIDVISKGIKQRNESIDAYVKGNRQDLADKEQVELDLYKAYLPAQLTEAEIVAIVDAAIAETGAKTIKEMGAVNKIVMPKIKGRADGKTVSEIVKSKLSK